MYGSSHVTLRQGRPDGSYGFFFVCKLNFLLLKHTQQTKRADDLLAPLRKDIGGAKEGSDGVASSFPWSFDIFVRHLKHFFVSRVSSADKL